jgi:hypothetical protein
VDGEEGEEEGEEVGLDVMAVRAVGLSFWCVSEMGNTPVERSPEQYNHWKDEERSSERDEPGVARVVLFRHLRFARREKREKKIPRRTQNWVSHFHLPSTISASTTPTPPGPRQRRDTRTRWSRSGSRQAARRGDVVVYLVRSAHRR